MKTDEEEVEWFKSKIDEYDCKNRLNLLQHHRKKDGLKEISDRMKAAGCYDAAAKKMVIKIKHPIFKNLGDIIWKIRNK